MSYVQAHELVAIVLGIATTLLVLGIPLYLILWVDSKLRPEKYQQEANEKAEEEAWKDLMSRLGHR